MVESSPDSDASRVDRIRSMSGLVHRICESVINCERVPDHWQGEVTVYLPYMAARDIIAKLSPLQRRRLVVEIYDDHRQAPIRGPFEGTTAQAHFDALIQEVATELANADPKVKQIIAARTAALGSG